MFQCLRVHAKKTKQIAKYAKKKKTLITLKGYNINSPEWNLGYAVTYKKRRSNSLIQRMNGHIRRMIKDFIS
jgi:hypothetical protein